MLPASGRISGLADALARKSSPSKPTPRRGGRRARPRAPADGLCVVWEAGYDPMVHGYDSLHLGRRRHRDQEACAAPLLVHGMPREASAPMAQF